MEIQNVTSGVNAQVHNNKDETNQIDAFKNAINDHDVLDSLSQDEEISFQKINGMTLGEIEEFYKDKQQNELLNTLKLSTLFSSNPSMNEAMFNMVLSQDGLQNSQSYLYNMMSNRNSYLSNENDNGAWLRKSIIDQLDGEVKAEQIKLEKEFQFTMLQFDVSAHMNDMMSFSKNERDRNEDNDDLFFSYDNMYLQYQSLFDEYESIENNNSSLLNQQLIKTRMNALNL